MTEEPQLKVKGSRLAAILKQISRAAQDIIHEGRIEVAGDVIEARTRRHPISAIRKYAFDDQIQFEELREAPAVD